MNIKYNLFEVTVSFKSLEWWNDKQERSPTDEPRSKKLKADPHIVEKYMQSKFWIDKYNSESVCIIVSIEKDIPLFDLISIARRLISIYGTTKNNDILHKIITATEKKDLLNHLNYIFQYVLEEHVIEAVLGPIERYIKRQLGIGYEDDKTLIVSSLEFF